MFRAHWRSRAVVASGLILAAAPIVAAQDGKGGDSGYRAATGLLHRGMFDLAASEYRAFLRDHAGDAHAADAHYGLGVCLTKLGKWDEAAGELDQVVEAKGFEFAPDALLLRAQCFLAGGDDGGAVERLRGVLERYPKYEHADAAAAMLGETLYREGKPGEARTVLERFGREWGQSASRPRAEFILALCDAAEGRDEPAADRLATLRKGGPGPDLAPSVMLAEAQCRHRLGEADQALELYKQALQSKQERVVPEAMLGVAQLTRAAGKPDDTGRVLDDLLKRFGTGAVADAARLERARVDFDLGKHERALAALEKLAAEEKSPLSAEASYWAAKCELRLGRLDAAAARLESAAKAHPESTLLPEMLYDRAVALQRGGHADEARRAYAGVRERFKDSALAPEALAAEAALAQGGGDLDGCEALCRRFLERYAKHARAAGVELLRAENDVLAGRLERAEGRFAEFLAAHPKDANAPQAAIRRGLVLAKLGKADEAAAALDGAVKNGGQSDPALLGAARLVLADSAMARSDWVGAERELKGVVETPKGRTADALLKLGLSIGRQGRADEALAVFEQVGKEFPKDTASVQAAFERGQVLVERQRFDEAKAAFESVIGAEEHAKEPRFTAYALRHLASIASRQGHPEEAAKLLARVAASGGEGPGAGDALYDQGVALLASGQYEEADGVFKRLLESAPGHPRAADARGQRAIAASRRGDFGAAVELCAEAERSAEAMRPDVRAGMRYENAWALRELGKTEQAVEAYKGLLGQPLSPALEAHGALDLSQLLIGAGDYAGAKGQLARAMKAAEQAGDPDGPQVAERALYLGAVCDVKAGKNAEAAAGLDSFLEKYPRSDLAVAAGLLSGQARLKAGHAEAAAERLRRVVDAGPPDATLGPALLWLGEACSASHQWAGSQGAFERYLAKFQESESAPQARFGVGWALENQGRQAEAIAAYRAAITGLNTPTEARAQFQIGESLFALKRYEEAARELLKVDILYAYPEWTAGALYEAGRCLGQLGQRDEAAKQFKQVIERFKDTEWARLASQQLATSAPASLPGGGAGGTR